MKEQNVAINAKLKTNSNSLLSSKFRLYCLSVDVNHPLESDKNA